MLLYNLCIGKKRNMEGSMISTYCDIHSHILPGVDDGATNIYEASSMLSIAYDEGIRCIVATPHFIADGSGVSMEVIQEAYVKVKHEANKISPDLKVFLGNELFHSQDILKLLEKGEALTINSTRYILIEFLPRTSFRDIWSSLHKYMLNGYYPILAHAERYIALVNNPGLVGDMVRSGIYIQINVGGITRRNNRTNFCNKLIKRGWVHFLGTDSHGAISRAPLIKEAAGVISRKYGKETLEKLMWNNPMAMLNNYIIEE